MSPCCGGYHSGGCPVEIRVFFGVDECLLREIGEFNKSLKSIAASYESMAHDVRLIREKEFVTVPADTTGIKVVPDSHPNPVHGT